MHQHSRRKSFLHRLPPSSQGSAPRQSPWSTKSGSSFNPGGYGDGRSRKRSVHISEEKTMQRLHTGVSDQTSPRSDGLHLFSKPRSTLRKNNAFLTSSRNSNKHDYYDGSWRVRNSQSSLYESGVRSITNDKGAQRALHKKMQKHKDVMARRWQNGGSVF